MRVTDAIAVTSEVTFLDEQSNPNEDQYVFGYTITIRNAGEQAATLHRRRWVITTDDGMVQVVSGEGVVGEAPCILPGQKYQYASFSVLATPVGSMHGHYEFELEGGGQVMVKIPAFNLAVPGVLH